MANNREAVKIVLSAMENYKEKVKAAVERQELELINMMRNRAKHLKDITDFMSQ